MIVFRLPSNVFVAVKNTKPFVPSGYSDLPEFTCHLNQKKCKEVNVYRVYTSSTNRNKAMGIENAPWNWIKAQTKHCHGYSKPILKCYSSNGTLDYIFSSNHCKNIRTLFDYQRHGLFQCLLRARRILLGRSKSLRFVHISIQAKQTFLKKIIRLFIVINILIYPNSQCDEFSGL